MGKSRTLVYQIGRWYTIKGEQYQVIRTEDYRKKNGRQGQRVTLESLMTGKTIEREQQYRENQ